MANESFNSIIFNANLKQKDFYSKKEKAEDSQTQEIYTRLKEKINNAYSNNQGTPVDFKFTTYDNIPSNYNVDSLFNKLKVANNTIKTNGAFYGFDIETIGDVGEKATDLDKKLFTITELSLLKRNANGKDEIVDSIQLGIDPNKTTELTNMLNRLRDKPISDFSSVQKSTFERLSRYSGNFHDRFNIDSNGIYHVTELADSDVTNFTKIQEGIDNLHRLYRLGQGYGDTKGKAQGMIRGFAKHLEEATSGNNALLGFNSRNFDMPRILYMFSQHGIKSNVDISKHVDVSDLFNSAFYGEFTDFYNKVTDSTGASIPKKELGRLQTIAKAYNANLKAHLADADTSFTMDFFLNNIPGYNSTMHEMMFKKLQDRINDGNKVSITDANKSSVVLFANKGLNNSPLDTVFDNKGNIKTYMTTGVKRRHSYKVNEVRYISNEELINGDASIKGLIQSHRIKANSNSKGYYVMNISDASTNIINKESINIIRDNLDDIQSIIQNDLSAEYLVGDGTKLDGISINQKMINDTTIDALKDNARRNLSSMEELNSNKGFAYAEKMYGAFENVNSAYAKALRSVGIDTPTIMSNDDANTLIKNGILNINNGNKHATININDIGNVAKNIDSLQNFQLLYNDLSNNHSTVKYVIDNINSKVTNTILRTSIEKRYATQYINKKKTAAFSKIMSNIKNNIVGQIHSNVSANIQLDDIFAASVVKPKQYGDISSVLVNASSGSTRINASSTQSATYGFLNLANSITREDRNGTITEQKKASALKGIANDFYDRGLIDTDTLKAINNINEPYNIAQTLGNNTRQIINNLTNIIGPDNINNLDDIEMDLYHRIFENTFSELNEQNVDGQLGRGIEFQQLYRKRTVENIQNDPTFQAIQQYKSLTGDIETHDYSLNYNGKSEDDYVNKFFDKNDLNNIINNSINDVQNINFADVNGRDRMGSDDFNKKADDLLRRHGYSQGNIDTFHDVMSNKGYGLLNANNNLAIALYETNGDNPALKLAITHKNNSSKLYQDLANGVTPNKASIIDLPEVNNEIKGMKYVQVGAMRKVVTQKLDIYPKHTGTDAVFNLMPTLRDTIDESLIGLKIMKGFIKENINNGIYTRTQSAVQRVVNKSVMSDKGYSGIEAIVDENNNTVKSFIPNQNDFRANNLINANEAVNYVPFLYETLDDDSPIKKQINLLWSNDKYRKNDANYSMQRWMEDLANGKIKTLEQLSGDQQQWFRTNIISGQNIINNVIKQSDRINKPDFTDPLKYIMSQNPNQYIKEQNVIGGFINLGNNRNLVPLEYLSPFSRPTVDQLLSMHPLNLSNKNTDGYFQRFHKTIRNKEQIKIGSTIVTPAYTEYINSMHESGLNLEYGITANIKRMTTEGVLDRIDYMRNALNNDKQFNKVFGKVMASNPQYTKQDIINILDKAEMMSSTWQQHSLVNPYLVNRIFKGHEVKTYQVGDMNNFTFADGLNFGSTVNKGSTIGYIDVNGEQKPIINTGSNGTITGFSNGRLNVQPIIPEINEIKLNALGGEKTVSSSFDRTPEMQPLVQTIWDSMFGRNIAQVSNLEMAKHENGSLVYGSNLFKIMDVAESKGQDEVNYLLNVMNNPEAVEGLTKEQINNLQSLKQMNISYFTDVHGIGRFNTSENPGEGNFFGGIDELVNIFSNRNSDYSNSLNDESITRTLISRVQMTEAHSANDGETDLNSKGVKINSRSSQVIGTETGNGNVDAFYDYVDGQYVKKMDTYLNTVKDRINRRNIGKVNETAKAQEDLGNIIHTVRHAMGVPTSDINEPINFNDLNIPISGVSANELNDTIFESIATNSSGERINTYSIKLPEGFTYTNPYTNAQDNILPIAHLNNHTVDGYAYLTGSQKAEADVLSSIARLRDMNDDKKGLTDLVDNMNNKIKNMFATFSDEVTDKNGILQKNLNTFRLPNSGYGLSNVSFAPVFAQDNNELVNRIISLDETDVKQNGLGTGYEGLRFRNKFNQDAIKVVDGKPQFYDISYTTRQQLEDMGTDFNKIGKQVYSKNYRGNITFKQNLINANIINKEGNPILQNIDLPHDKVLLDMLQQTDIQGRTDASDFLKNVISTYRKQGSLELLNIDGLNDINKYILKTYTNEINKFYDQVGTAWMQQVGVMGLIGRAPYFHDTSFRVSNIRLGNLDGKTVQIQPWTLVATNDDHDGDNLAISLNLVDGQLDAVNSKAEQTLRDVYEAQAKYSNGYLAYKAINDYNGSKDINGKNAYTRDTYNKIVTMSRGDDFAKNQNYYYIKGADTDAIITRQFKANIGGISTPNLSVRNAADVVLTNNKSNMNIRQSIYDFTKKTEQQLIDTKHLQDIADGISEKPTPTGYYLNGLQQMADAKTKQDTAHGLANIITALNQAQLIDKNNVNINDIMNGVNKDNSEINNQLIALTQMFNNSKTKSVYNNAMSINAPRGIDNKIQFIGEVASNANNFADSPIASQKVNLINNTVNATSKGNSTINNINNSDTTYMFRRNGNMYSYSGTGVGKNTGLNYMRFTNQNDSNDIINIYGSNSKELLENVNNNYYNLGNVNINNSDANNYRNIVRLRNNNIINDSQGGELIRAFNEDIKRRGANPSNTNQIMFDYLTNNKIVNVNNISGMNRYISNLDNRISPNINSINVNELIQNVNNTKIYNETDALRRLNNNLQSQINDSNSEVLKNPSIANRVNNQLIEEPMNNIKNTNASARNSISNYIQQIANANTNESNAYMNWNDINSNLSNKELLNSLQNSKIGYGDYANQRIGDLDIDTLNSIYNSSNDESSRAIQETKRRIGMYFSTLDTNDLGNNIVGDINSNNVKLYNSTIDDNIISDLTPLNDAIKEAGSGKQAFNKHLNEQSSLFDKLFTRADGSRNIKAMLLGGAAIMVAGGIISHQLTAQPNTLRPENKNNGSGAPAPDGSYDDIQLQAPSTPKSVRVADNRNTGVKYQISGNVDSSFNHDNMVNAINNVIDPRGGHVSINTTNKNKDVDQNWLQNQVSNAIT